MKGFARALVLKQRQRELGNGLFRYMKILTWLRGLGEYYKKKSHRSSGVIILFLLFYSPKPRNRVRVFIYRNWSILASIIRIE